MRPRTNPKTVETGVSADTIVLCGGQGTRLRPVIADRPKVLARIGAKTFIDILLDYLSGQGFARVILATGYKGEMLREHLRRRSPAPLYSEEREPLGTGGAAKQAWPLTQTPHVIVLNGDTLCPVDLRDVFGFHLAKQALMTMVVSLATRPDGGSIELDAEGRMIRFEEKAGVPARYINAGIYVFRADALRYMPVGDAFSLEHDFFPSLIRTAPCYGYVTELEPVDIGTPERYERAVRKFGGV